MRGWSAPPDQLGCITKYLATLSLRLCGGVQVTWRWQGFSNSARTDGLQLEHWVKCYKDPTGKVKPAEEGEYSFAKYNKKVWEPLQGCHLPCLKLAAHGSCPPPHLYKGLHVLSMPCWYVCPGMCKGNCLGWVQRTIPAASLGHLSSHDCCPRGKNDFVETTQPSPQPAPALRGLTQFACSGDGVRV